MKRETRQAWLHGIRTASGSGPAVLYVDAEEEDRPARVHTGIWVERVNVGPQLLTTYVRD